ncbi:hypothetical protein AAFF_G00007600 [Aldrovandia affinis]|uniref:ribonuclease H n=1 Tax=Aldrovandia affinis TaxID=143900 RepID=A0AAD7WZL5_9TELE|nr:hypothetical protein AAFF_G00007600 [Aldrovandia affinis]
MRLIDFRPFCVAIILCLQVLLLRAQQGLGSAPGTSRFLPGFVSQSESDASGRRARRTPSTRSRMPVMRGLLAPQNTFLDTIATRFDGTLAGSTWFSALTLHSGYWQVPLSPSAQPKTAFTIGRGLWEFNVMLFGLCNSPAMFKRLMEKILQPVPASACVVYLDAILVHTPTYTAALKNLR